MLEILNACTNCGKKRGNVFVQLNRANTLQVIFARCDLCGAKTRNICIKPNAPTWEARKTAAQLWSNGEVNAPTPITNTPTPITNTPTQKQAVF